MENPVGRPRIYNTPEELIEAIQAYFFPDGELIKKPTITGLSLSLGFADKTTLYEYRDRAEFSYPVKRAITMIERFHEEGLSENNVAGRIFALKNMGWRDKQETEISGKDGAPPAFDITLKI